LSKCVAGKGSGTAEAESRTELRLPVRVGCRQGTEKGKEEKDKNAHRMETEYVEVSNPEAGSQHRETRRLSPCLPSPEHWA
jgi:hypothetical protein